MVSCPSCGKRNPEGARVCFACGRPFPVDPSLPLPEPRPRAPEARRSGRRLLPEPRPVPTEPTPRAYLDSPFDPAGSGRLRRRPQGYVHDGRRAASVIVVIGCLLVVAAVVTPWWGISGAVPSGDAALEFEFLPGDHLTSTCTGSCNGIPAGDPTYEQRNLSGVGAVYEVTVAILVTSLALGVSAAALGWLGAYGVNFGRRQLRAAVGCAIAATVAAAFAVVTVAVAQPLAMSAGLPEYGEGVGAGATFWGMTGTGVSWGASFGWYAAIVAAACLALGTIVLLRDASDPFTLAEIEADRGSHR